MEADGRAVLLMSLWDTGTGAHTILRQVVAEALTLPVDEVEIEIQDTDAVTFESGPGGSRVTYTAGHSVLGASNDLRDKLGGLAAEYLGSSTDLMVLQQGRFSDSTDANKTTTVADVAARAVASGLAPLEGSMSFTSPPSEFTSYCTQVAEVEVDRETGQVRVNKIITAHDVGTVINPVTHQGQIEGGVIQGLGYAVMEEMQTEEGRVSNVGLGDYKIPTIKDVPELVTVLLEPSVGPAPFDGKGIGESSNTPVAGAVANAVFDAVGVRIMDLPVTAEKVRKALREKEEAGG
jgi:CO/xanthine dehydrogenase Mo-binding subunit